MAPNSNKQGQTKKRGGSKKQQLEQGPQRFEAAWTHGNSSNCVTKFTLIGFVKCFSNFVTRVNVQNQRKYTKDKRNYQAVDQNNFGTQNIFKRQRSCDQKRWEHRNREPS